LSLQHDLFLKHVLGLCVERLAPVVLHRASIRIIFYFLADHGLGPRRLDLIESLVAVDQTCELFFWTVLVMEQPVLDVIPLVASTAGLIALGLASRLLFRRVGIPLFLFPLPRQPFLVDGSVMRHSHAYVPPRSISVTPSHLLLLPQLVHLGCMLLLFELVKCKEGLIRRDFWSLWRCIL